MNRKYFISSLITVGAAFYTMKGKAAGMDKAGNSKPKIPPYLKPGDCVGICSPAGYIALNEIQPAVLLLQSWGFRVQIGSSVGKKDFTYGGRDEERLVDLQQMLDDQEINAVMCARGGYGLVRILRQLRFDQFAAHPKWVIGFSDVTVLHNHINRNFNVATIHSKMCNSFPSEWTAADPVQIATILSVRQALTGEDFKYQVPAMSFNRYGRAEGQLVGGNLSIIASLSGTDSDLDTRGKILFLEDTGEYLYSIDRMFWNLKLSGKLEKLAGLVIGGFKLKPDDAGDEFGQSVYEIVMEKIKEYNYPVCFDFPVGHQKNNFALKCGVRHVLEVGAQGATLRSVYS